MDWSCPWRVSIRYGLNLRTDRFCIVSVVRGRGVVQMAGAKKAVGPHEHFCVPAGIPAFLQQEGNEPMVTSGCGDKGSAKPNIQSKMATE